MSKINIDNAITDINVSFKGLVLVINKLNYVIWYPKHHTETYKYIISVANNLVDEKLKPV